jgi:biotin transport system substrate-specific component
MPASSSAFSGTLLDRSLAQTDARAAVRVGAVLLAVVLTAIAAQFTLHVPFKAVPFTLTPLAVMLTGAALGSRLGFVAQVLYLAAGAAGLPVFAPSPFLPPGAGRLIGPTGGYLLAYPVAAFVTGWLAERGWDRRYGTSFASMLAGLAIIFIGGISWLSVLPGGTLWGAVADGFTSFIVWDIMKAAIAAFLLPAAWRLLGDGGARQVHRPNIRKY